MINIKISVAHCIIFNNTDIANVTLQKLMKEHLEKEYLHCLSEVFDTQIIYEMSDTNILFYYRFNKKEKHIEAICLIGNKPKDMENK